MRFKMGEIKKMFANYAERSTMHGIGFISSSRSLKARIFWSVVCLASMSMFIFMLSNLVIQYLQFNVLVRVDEVSDPIQ